MKVNRRDLDNAVVLELKGQLTGGPDAEKFRDLFKALVDEGRKSVIVNLKDVDWISSTGIGIMIRAYKTIREADGQLVLVRVGERTQQIFNVLRLYDVFKIMDTEEQAREYMANPTT